MRNVEPLFGGNADSHSEASDRVFVALAVAALLCALAIFVLWFSSLSTGAASDLLEQNPPPPGSLTPEAKEFAQQFKDFSGAIPVVTYTMTENSPEASTFRPALFAAQMQVLSEAGFTSVTAEQVRALAMREEVDLPNNPVLITFDGADSRLWVDVDPILKLHGFTATVFLTSEELTDPGNATQMSTATLKEMKKSNRWEFGSHVSEDALARKPGEPLLIWENRVRDELITARLALTDVIDVSPIAFSYPMSETELEQGDRAVAVRLPELVGAQFDLGFLETNRSIVVSDQIDKSRAPRLPADRSSLQPFGFLGAIGEVLPQSTSTDLKNYTWIGEVEGACSFAEETLVLSADRTTTCQLVSGVQDVWGDIAIAGILDRVSESTTASFRLREDELHQVEVSFSPTDVLVRRKVNGEWEQLKVVMLLPEERLGPQPIALQLRGTRLQVTVAGREIASEDIGPGLKSGRVSLSAITSEADGLIVTEMSIAIPSSS